MTPYIYVASAEHCGDYKIKLGFNTGEEKVVDFASFISRAQHPDIKKYQDIAAFQGFRITDGDLEWNDYELCFPVFDLYQQRIN